MKLKFNVTGMTCAACSARVEKVTNAVPGVEKAEVNLLAGTMQVEAENGNVVPAIIKAVQDAGYNAALPGEKKTEKAEAAPAEAALKEMKKRIIGSAMWATRRAAWSKGRAIARMTSSGWRLRTLRVMLRASFAGYASHGRARRCWRSAHRAYRIPLCGRPQG